jgi:hypothetical protein
VFPELFTDNRKHRNLISDKSNILLQLIDIFDKFSRRFTVPAERQGAPRCAKARLEAIRQVFRVA